MRSKHARRLNQSAVEVLLIVFLDSFIQFFTHNVFAMIGFFILGGITYSSVPEIGQYYSQALWIVVTCDCLIVLFKILAFGKSVYLKSLLRRLFFYLIFIKGYYYLQDSKGVVFLSNVIVLFGLLIVFLYIFGERIWPKIFNKYILSRVLNEDYLASKDFDELSGENNFFKDSRTQDGTDTMRKIDQSIVKDSLKKSLVLEAFTYSASLIRERKRWFNYRFSIVEKRYDLQFILFLFDGNTRFYYRLPRMTFTKLMESETAVSESVGE